MGLLGSIGNAIKKTVVANVKAVGTILNVATVSLAHPVKTAEAVISPTKTVNQVVQQHFSQSLPRQITETVVGTAAIGSGIAIGSTLAFGAGAGVLATSTAAGLRSIGAAIIPTSTTNKVIFGALALPAGVAVFKNPAVVTNTLTGVINVESNLIKTAASDNPNELVTNLKGLVTENPFIVGGATVLGAFGLGKSILPAVVGLVSSERISDQTKAIEDQTKAIERTGTNTITKETIVIYKDKPLPTDDSAPITPQTTTVTSGKRKTRKRIAKPTLNINQRVNVIVGVRNSAKRTTKNYISKVPLYN